MKNQKYTNFQEYLDLYPTEVQKKLKTLRELILNLAPKAEETISYGIPAFKLNGKAFIYIAAYENHISVYPFPYGEDEFQKLSEGYKTSKGTIQFQLDKETPLALVKKIVQYRIDENSHKFAKA